MSRYRGLLCRPAASSAAGFLFLLASGTAGAEGSAAPEEAIDLVDFDQIIVVAHKDERSIREVAANVTVLSQDRLKDQLAASISDVFRHVPGIDYEAAGTRFGAEGISIRGIGGNRVAILVDGVPLSDQFDVGSFSNATRDFLDTGLIRDIEVLHGPASALYGSAAIGGVVSVRTPDPADIAGSDDVGGDVLATWRGSDQSAHGQATFALNGPSAGFMVGASRREGQESDAAAAPSGVDTNDYVRQSALAKLVGDDSWGNTWRASFIHQDADTRSDLNSMLGQGRFRSTTALEGDDSYQMNLVNLAWEFDSAESWVDSGVVRAFYETASVEQATLDERANARTPVSINRYFGFDQRIRGLDINLWKDFVGDRISHRFGFGVEYHDRRTEEFRDGLSTDLSNGQQTNVLLGEEFPLRDFPISETTEAAAYVEDTISIGDWTLIAALRADRFELSPEQDPMYLEDYPFAELVSLEESDVSPKLGLIWNATPGIDVYAQYSHGFRAPPYADANIGLEIPFFNYRAIPNPDLKSESSDGFDLGIRLMSVNSSARLSLFHTRYEDFIESKIRLGEDPVTGRILFQSQNIRATTIAGAEGAYAVRFGGLHGNRRAFGFDIAAYYARGENDDTGEALNSVGPAQAVVGLSWFSMDERAQVRVIATLTDAWDDRDETRGDLFKPPGHTVFDLYFSQSLGRNTRVRAGLHNLTDRTYWQWSEVRGLSDDDPIIPYLSQAGRSASVSLNIMW
ncbi:MAG: TonB-dependent hemoglobin/transferrin/lactoferrin family receptor [Gammaproteobacteria bacterium]|nr:TonB-dependent hemoglobin/transferrin/lactoferrin family receptor [Gammaproteobacteria bacterium]